MSTHTFTLKVKPGCRKPGPPVRVRLADGSPVLQLDVKAPPVEGKANHAVITQLADILDVPKSALTLTHGSSGRLKRLVLEADTATCIRVQAWLDSLPLK